MVGLEPTLAEANRILSPVRLPFRHIPDRGEFTKLDLAPPEDIRLLVRYKSVPGNLQVVKMILMGEH